MEHFKWKLEKFMKGRNGPDELGRDIGVASIIIYFFYHRKEFSIVCSGFMRNVLLYFSDAVLKSKKT